MIDQPAIEHAPKTLLVTGGAGFIGSNFILYWLKRYPNDKIINLDALTYAGNQENLRSVSESDAYHFVQGDIGDTSLVSKLMQGVDTVVHFAAESHVDRSILEPSAFVRTNVLGTQVLLDAALKNKVRHFHHISTDEVFGSLELNSEQQFSETTPYDPRSPYSASKAGSDMLVRAYGETYGLSYSITNCSNNYGEFQFPEKLIPLAVTNLLGGKTVPVYGAGNQVRDWLYVQDHCRAIELVLLGEPKRTTYVVGGLTEDISNLEVVQLILEIMRLPQDQIEFVSDRPGHDARYSVDWSLIQQDCGWQPSVSFREGLERTIQWYTTHEAWWRPLQQRLQDFYQQNYTNRKGTHEST